MARIVRLTESDLSRIVRRVLSEDKDDLISEVWNDESITLDAPVILPSKQTSQDVLKLPKGTVFKQDTKGHLISTGRYGNESGTDYPYTMPVGFECKTGEFYVHYAHARQYLNKSYPWLKTKTTSLCSK